jgi:hypothetical protein
MNGIRMNGITYNAGSHNALAFNAVVGNGNVLNGVVTNFNDSTPFNGSFCFNVTGESVNVLGSGCIDG